MNSQRTENIIDFLTNLQTIEEFDGSLFINNENQVREEIEPMLQEPGPTTSNLHMTTENLPSPTKERVAQPLRDIAISQCTNNSMSISSCAALLGKSRSTVSRIVAKFKQTGVKTPGRAGGRMKKRTRWSLC